MTKEEVLKQILAVEGIETIWHALHTYREELIPEGDKQYDDEWDEICTAMAWIEEKVLAEFNYD